MTIHVLSTLGVLGVLRDLLPLAEAAGLKAEVRFDPTARLLAAIDAGARGDVAILTDAGIADLAQRGILAAGTRRDLARSYVGMAVRAGAPKPAIGTVAELRATLLAAPSIVYSAAGASGIFFAGLIERLGIAEAINAKATVIPQGFTAERVARGEAVLAIQQVSELMAIEGVDIVGKLPAEANTCAVFTSALFEGAGEGAAPFHDWLAGALTPDRLRAAGLDPA
ncbi:substrate-binding domain-containing protein [Humitalea sp. 24SJ18S-53]|uniref:substrate-binding domain-containing protein n=1 Tax=Humitalea sp. 24SJ18S-53 TaxID=3422307 RepID=UPI003D679C52